MLIAKALNGLSTRGSPFRASLLAPSLYADHAIAYIGDSTTSPAYQARWGAVGGFARSNDLGLSAGDGTLTLYSDGTATWAAPGDTAGAAVPVGDGLVWLESNSDDMGCCFNITQEMIDALATPEGYDVTVTIEASAYTGYGSEAPATFGQILSGYKLNVSQYGGIAGETTENLVSRLPSILTRDNFGRPLSGLPRIAVVLIGINDVAGIVAGDPGCSVVATNARITVIKDYIASRGVIAVFCTLAGETNTAPEWAVMEQINTHITGMANGSSVRAVDYASVIVDPMGSNGAALPGTMDGAHYTALGANIAGELLAAEILDITGGSAGDSDFRSGGRANLYVVNGNLATGGADTGQGGAGVISGDYGFSTVFETAGDCAGSRVADPGQFHRQVFDFTNAVAGDAFTCLIAMTGISPGDSVYSALQYSITGDGCASFTYGVRFSDGDANIEIWFAASPATINPGSQSGVLETPEVIVPSWATEIGIALLVTMLDGDTVVEVYNVGAA